MFVICHSNKTTAEVVRNLLFHLIFNLFQNFIGIRHEKIFGVDLHFFEVLKVVFENCVEAIPLAGKVVPVGPPPSRPGF